MTSGILSLLLIGAAQTVQVNFDEPTLDRWMYPFNQTPGTKAFASIFSPLTEAGFLPEFDNRDGQMIVGYDTSGVVTPGLGASSYSVTAVTVTIMVVSDLTFGYDPTLDPYTSWLDAGDPEFAPDPDPGRAVELFGAGFRCGFDATTFPENGQFCDGCNCVLDCRDVRCVYPTDYDGCTPRDVSNNVDDRFDPTPWAVGTNQGLTPGQLVPANTDLTFELDVNDPCVQAYLKRAVNDGVLDLVIASVFPSEQQQTGTFPQLYTKDNVLVQLELAEAARLEMTVEVGLVGDLDGSGSVGTIDLLILLSGWGDCPDTPTLCPADLDGNGVSTADLLLLLSNWG